MLAELLLPHPEKCTKTFSIYYLKAPKLWQKIPKPNPLVAPRRWETTGHCVKIWEVCSINRFFPSTFHFQNMFSEAVWCQKRNTWFLYYSLGTPLHQWLSVRGLIALGSLPAIMHEKCRKSRQTGTHPERWFFPAFPPPLQKQLPPLHGFLKDHWLGIQHLPLMHRCYRIKMSCRVAGQGWKKGLGSAERRWLSSGPSPWARCLCQGLQASATELGGCTQNVCFVLQVCSWLWSVSPSPV